MSPLPSTWALAKIQDVAEILAGYGFPENLQGRTSGDVPFYKVGDISENWKKGERYLKAANNYVSKSDLAALRARLLPRGTTVFAKIGAAIALNRRALLGEDALVDNNVMGLSPRVEIIDPVFLFHYACTLRLGELAKATTVPSVRKSDVGPLTIPVPPLPEQKRISNQLEALLADLDAGIANLKRVQANLKRYRASVLKAACEGRLVPTEAELGRKEGRTYETGEQLLARILKERRAKWEADQLAKMLAAGKPPKNEDWKKKYKEPEPPDASPLPELPEGWTWASLDQITVDALIGLDRGRASQQIHGPGSPYVKMNNVDLQGRVNFEEVVYVHTAAEELARFLLRDGDILFNTRNSVELVGKTGLVENPPKDCVFNNNLMRIRIADLACPRFVSLQMCSSEFRKRLELVKRATTNVAAVYAKDLFPLLIALPPIQEQKRIAEEVARLSSVMETVEVDLPTTSFRAGRLRQSILKRAFEGKLVPQDPNEEPASVLLERIRSEQSSRMSPTNSTRLDFLTTGKTRPIELGTHGKRLERRVERNSKREQSKSPRHSRVDAKP